MSGGVREAADPLVRVRNLKTHYEDRALFGAPPVRAVDGVSFDIEAGETLGLVGESGCGKTTLGRTLARLEDPTAGTIEYDGEDVSDLAGAELKRWRRNVGIVFQDPDSSLDDRMTVGEIVREPLDVHGVGTPKERRARVRELLADVGLAADHRTRYPHQFSGGQRQRISIARALALDPEFLILDEPVSALDASVQAKVLNLLADLQDEMGLTYLLIAHDLAVMRHVCDRVAVMYLGHIMELAPAEELFTDPANPYTKSLLSAIPDPDPTSERERIVLRGTPPSPRDPPAGCPFSTRCPAKIRPDEWELSDDAWVAIEDYRTVLRERARADRSLSERLKRRFGLAGGENVAEIEAAVFEGVELPDGAADKIERATERAADGDPAGAADTLVEAFGGVCDAEAPEVHQVGTGERTSLCHRHAGEYDDPEL
jgi:peptide/nickel transport system ATP-binding protein